MRPRGFLGFLDLELTTLGAASPSSEGAGERSDSSEMAAAALNVLDAGADNELEELEASGPWGGVTVGCGQGEGMTGSSGSGDGVAKS